MALDRNFTKAPDGECDDPFLMRAGLAGLGAWHALTGWSHRENTDGRVPALVAYRLGAPVDDMIAAGLLEVDKADDAYLHVARYRQYQQDSEHREAARLAYSIDRSEAGKASARSPRHHAAKGEKGRFAKVQVAPNGTEQAPNIKGEGEELPKVVPSTSTSLSHAPAPTPAPPSSPSLEDLLKEASWDALSHYESEHCCEVENSTTWRAKWIKDNRIGATLVLEECPADPPQTGNELFAAIQGDLFGAQTCYEDGCDATWRAPGERHDCPVREARRMAEQEARRLEREAAEALEAEQAEREAKLAKLVAQRGQLLHLVTVRGRIMLAPDFSEQFKARTGEEYETAIRDLADFDAAHPELAPVEP